MSRPRRRVLGGTHAAMLVGWLFADLLLVLFLIAIGSLPPPAVAGQASPAASATASAEVTPSAKPASRVLEQTPHAINVNVLPGRIRNSATRAAAVQQLLADLRQQLAAQGLQGRQAGFVLVFAYGPIGGINQAVETANDVLGILKAQENEFREVSGLGYWSGSGSIAFKIFFFV